MDNFQYIYIVHITDEDNVPAHPRAVGSPSNTTTATEAKATTATQDEDNNTDISILSYNKLRPRLLEQHVVPPLVDAADPLLALRRSGRPKFQLLFASFDREPQRIRLAVLAVGLDVRDESQIDRCSLVSATDIHS